MRGEFTDTSFLSPARLFEFPVTPDFLASGDFDADGHFDIAAASRNENSIYYLRGNGKGEFEFFKRVELEGNVTAFLSGDFNRRDGLNDLIVAVQTKQKGQLLIFEHPYGAMKATPEVFTFNAPITSLVINFVDGNAHPDLAIAAGNELAILCGRDRKLLSDASGNLAEKFEITRKTFDFQIEALAVGEFIKSKTYKTEIALLANDGKVHLLENGGTADTKGFVSADWLKTKTVSLPDNLSNDGVPLMLTARVSSRSVDTLVIGCG